MRQLFLSFLVLLFVAGCGPVHTGPQISHDKLDQIIEGQTTKGEVLALFGEMPTTQTRDSSGMTTLTWVHMRRDYNWMLGIYLPAASDVVTVVFDKNDIVQRFSYGGTQNTQEVWQEPAGTSTKPDLGVQKK